MVPYSSECAANATAVLLHSSRMNSTEPRGDSPLVLLVEDDRDTREMYAMCLRASGYRVEQAVTARDALGKAAAVSPDVVVTDLSLPGMDGLALASQLHQHPQLGAIPVIAVTGYSMANDAGLHDIAAVLVKPCLPDDLVKAVARALSMVPPAGSSES